MKRALLTGMSGTGKSAVTCGLAARGYKAVDLDDPEWSEWIEVPGHPGVSAAQPGRDWVWREDRVRDLLATEDADALFLSGCASNQGKFYAQLDHIVLLTAPVPVMLERLATRTSNPYGKDPAEVAMVLQNTREVVPLLRRRATLEVDTSAPVEQVIETILRHVLHEAIG
jgi:shikimate kinase